MTGNPHAPGRCRDLVAQINDYLDGDLSPRRVAALERHLADCVCCTGFAESLRRAVDASRAAGRSMLPADVRRRAKARIAELIGSEQRRSRKTRAR